MTESSTNETTSPTLTLSLLQEAVQGNAAAIRQVTRLEPSGDPGDKVFPPTYQGGIYATETRRIKGQDVKCVLLDSVQSQANRMEQALLAACNEAVGGRRRLEMPLLAVEFTEFPDIGRITALDAPHRIADAIFRDSELGGVKFRETEDGRAFESSNLRNATALFRLCPTALIFGTWDSTGSQGGHGNKFARAVVAEIVGFGAAFGVRTSSRIDPLGIRTCDIYEDASGDWTTDESRARKSDDGLPIKYGKNKETKGKPSALNHSNVVPDLVRYKENVAVSDVLKAESVQAKKGEIAPGGVTVDYAQQTTVLSLAALRRLQFPNGEVAASSERNHAARTVLAALGLVAITLQREQGYFLRSRCDLIPSDDDVTFEIVRSAKTKPRYTLTADQAIELLDQAVAVATGEDIGLEWPTVVVALQPRQNLVALVRESREASGVVEGGGE